MARKLRSASRYISATYDNAVRPFGLRMTQATLLVAVARGEGTATSETLARALRMDKSTFSRNLTRLEEAGWTRRDQRGREALLSITPAGEEKLKEIFPSWSAAQEQVRTWLTPDHIATLDTLLRHLPES